MPFKRMTVMFSFAFLAISCSSAWAGPLGQVDIGAWQMDAASATASLSGSPSGMRLPAFDDPVSAVSAPRRVVSADIPVRKLLADFAITLRDIRYRRGGRMPSTGFDCSGFVRYVFEHSVGAVLPSDSASQFHVGTAVDRADMKTGDLVFFRIHGKRVSHVGIYLDNGRFIHSPSTGKTVSINRLDDGYWARHFVAAKRPKVLS